MVAIGVDEWRSGGVEGGWMVETRLIASVLEWGRWMDRWDIPSAFCLSSPGIIKMKT
jgi:hypothetical protein